MLKIISLLALLSLPGIVVAQEEAGSVSGSVAIEYTGVYRSGNAPLKPKSRIKITRTGPTYEIVSSQGGDPWSLPLKSLRGAVAAKKGIWLYWFDSSDMDQLAQIDIDSGAQVLADMINRDIREYNQAPQIQDDSYKQRYEEYHQRAIKESR